MYATLPATFSLWQNPGCPLLGVFPPDKSSVEVFKSETPHDRGEAPVVAINFTKSDIPSFLSGNGTITVNANVPQIDKPFPATTTNLLDLDFGVAGNEPFVFGAANSVKLGIQAGAKARLAVFGPQSSSADVAILAQYGLDTIFQSHPDNLVIGLLIDANAAVTASGTYAYSVFTASATLDAGGAVQYSYLRAYPGSQTVSQILQDYFKNLQSPGNVIAALPFGEVISFEYNGYVKFGGSFGVGYELKGSPSFDIGQLQLSENYDLSIVGKLGLTASVAGEFAIQVRWATDSSGMPMAGWVRLILSKKRNSQFGLAADVNIGASLQLQGLPDSGNEFLGALLGVQAKNWLNLFARIQQLSDPAAIKQELDDLATKFLDEWIGKAFNQLSATEFSTFLSGVQRVVDSYQNLDNSAISLFDKYFDKLDALTAKLNQLVALTSWDRLKGEINSDLWDIVQRLTDGDPLGWILGQIQIPGTGGVPTNIPSLPKFIARVQQTLALIQSDAHAEIRNVIALAKASFGLDGFFKQLDQIDSIPKLKALAEQKLGGFVERLIGSSVDKLSNTDLGTALTRIHQALTAAKNFEENWYAKLKDAANQSLSIAIHAEYSRASERDALIDIMVNVSTDLGKSILRSAASGDFQTALAGYQPDVVRLNKGLLTHSIAKSTAFNINVVGWHGGWHYQGMDRVIVNASQQIVPEANALLSVYTTIDMSKERTRQRTGQKVYTNLLLRFIGESHGILSFDKKNQEYLIDVITGMAGTYELSFQNQNASAAKLQYYLSFASDFGLVAPGATPDSILKLLPPVASGSTNFGPVTVDYKVRYTELALRRVFAATFDANAARQLMRKLILANYLRDSGLTDLGWCYWTSPVYDLWKQGQAEFTNHSQLQFQPIAASPFSQTREPEQVTLQRTQLLVLSTLYYIEDDFISGLQKLDSLIHGTQIQPQAFANALSGIGSALKNLDDFGEGVNTIFCLFDQFVRKQMPGPGVRESSLDIQSTVEGHTVEKVLLAG